MTDINEFIHVQATGNKGLGVFAKRDIPQGQRILEETPLLFLPPQESTPEHMWKHFDAMSEADRSKYCQLSFDNNTVSNEIVQQARDRLPRGKDQVQLAERSADEIKMHAIFHRNAISLGPNKQWGGGVFEFYSRINHSCTPNVNNTYNPQLKKEVVHATRDIASGEEITTSYIPLDRPHAERRVLLWPYRFECSCEACDGQYFDEHEMRRTGLSDIQRILDLKVHAGEVKLDLLAAYIKILRQEGLLGMDLALAYGDCAEVCLKLENFAKALEFAKLEREVELYCLGPETDYMQGSNQYAFWRINAAEEGLRRDIEEISRTSKQASSEVSERVDDASTQGKKDVGSDQEALGASSVRSQPGENVTGNAEAQSTNLTKTQAKKKRRAFRKATRAVDCDEKTIDALFKKLTYEERDDWIARLTAADESEASYLYAELGILAFEWG